MNKQINDKAAEGVQFYTVAFPILSKHYFSQGWHFGYELIAAVIDFNHCAGFIPNLFAPRAASPAKEVS